MPSHYCPGSRIVSLLQNEDIFETHANLNVFLETDFQLPEYDNLKKTLIFDTGCSNETVARAIKCIGNKR